MFSCETAFQQLCQQFPLFYLLHPTSNATTPTTTCTCNTTTSWQFPKQLENLKVCIDHWGGPVLAAMYISSRGQIDKLELFIAKNKDTYLRQTNIHVVLEMNEYPVLENNNNIPKMKKLEYPTNYHYHQQQWRPIIIISLITSQVIMIVVVVVNNTSDKDEGKNMTRKKRPNMTRKNKKNICLQQQNNNIVYYFWWKNKTDIDNNNNE